MEWSQEMAAKLVKKVPVRERKQFARAVQEAQSVRRATAGRAAPHLLAG